MTREEAREQAITAVQEKTDQLYHNYRVLVEVNCEELARLGILDAYNVLRNAQLTEMSVDHVTLGQAIALGLIKAPNATSDEDASA